MSATNDLDCLPADGEGEPPLHAQEMAPSGGSGDDGRSLTMTAAAPRLLYVVAQHAVAADDGGAACIPERGTMAGPQRLELTWGAALTVAGAPARRGTAAATAPVRGGGGGGGAFLRPVRWGRGLAGAAAPRMLTRVLPLPETAAAAGSSPVPVSRASSASPPLPPPAAAAASGGGKGGGVMANLELLIAAANLCAAAAAVPNNKGSTAAAMMVSSC